MFSSPPPPKPKAKLNEEYKDGLTQAQKEQIIDFLNRFHNIPKKTLTEHKQHIDKETERGWYLDEESSRIQYEAPSVRAEHPGPSTAGEFYYDAGHYERDIYLTFSQDFKDAIRENIDNPAKIETFLKQFKNGVERIDDGELASFYVIKDANVLKQLNELAQSWKNDIRIAVNKDNVSATVAGVSKTNPSIANLITNLAAGGKEKDQQTPKPDSSEQSSQGPKRTR